MNFENNPQYFHQFTKGSASSSDEEEEEQDEVDDSPNAFREVTVDLCGNENEAEAPAAVADTRKDEPEEETVAIRTRDYQLEMFEESMKRNVIVSMETGSGKTYVAILRVIAELERCPEDRVSSLVSSRLEGDIWAKTC